MEGMNDVHSLEVKSWKRFIDTIMPVAIHLYFAFIAKAQQVVFNLETVKLILKYKWKCKASRIA